MSHRWARIGPGGLGKLGCRATVLGRVIRESVQNKWASEAEARDCCWLKSTNDQEEPKKQIG